MRIAMVLLGYHPTVGGIGRHVAMFTQGLRKRGHVVDIITTDWAPADYEQEAGVLRLKSGLFGRSKGLSEHLNGYDIVHAHGYQTFQPYQVIKAVHGKIPVVFTPHYHPFGKKPRLVRKAFDFYFGRKAMEGVDRIIVQSPFEKALLSKFGVDYKVRMVPVPISDMFFRTGAKSTERERTVLYVGRIERYKGLMVLVKAFKKIDIKDSDLLIVGNDCDGTKNEVENYIEKNGIRNIKFAGSVDEKELLKIYQKASLLVLPSVYENVGLVLLEAMSQGVPVIGTNVGGVPFILDYGKAGIIVPYGNEEILAEKIRVALTDTNLTKKLQKNGCKHVKKFRINKLTRELEKVYEELV